MFSRHESWFCCHSPKIASPKIAGPKRSGMQDQGDLCDLVDGQMGE
jgi:hypothetical protein